DVAHDGGTVDRLVLGQRQGRQRPVLAGARPYVVGGDVLFGDAGQLTGPVIVAGDRRRRHQEAALGLGEGEVGVREDLVGKDGVAGVIEGVGIPFHAVIGKHRALIGVEVVQPAKGQLPVVAGGGEGGGNADRGVTVTDMDLVDFVFN